MPMDSSKPKFPYFIPTPVRDLTIEERDTICKLLERAEPIFSEQVTKLQVVGRCGCGQCSTVFFEPDEPGVKEQDLSTYAGKDKEGGIVAAVLLQKQGRLSQLEYYSVDGPDPWYPPKAENLKPYD
jgi:hypothetical protein